jgi:hypothetical protein
MPSKPRSEMTAKELIEHHGLRVTPARVDAINHRRTLVGTNAIFDTLAMLKMHYPEGPLPDAIDTLVLFQPARAERTLKLLGEVAKERNEPLPVQPSTAAKLLDSFGDEHVKSAVRLALDFDDKVMHGQGMYPLTGLEPLKLLAEFCRSARAEDDQRQKEAGKARRETARPYDYRHVREALELLARSREEFNRENLEKAFGAARARLAR